MRLVTSYWPKPIPTSIFDWEAWIDGREEQGPKGYGETEEEAVAELAELLADGEVN